MAGEDLHPLVTDDFVLVPNPRTCDPERKYSVCFTAKQLAREESAPAKIPIPVADGHMVVCWKRQRTPPRHLLIHFHGAPDAVKKPFLRSRLNAVLAVVNFPGLSSAYSRPFEQDERLFDQITARAATEAALSETAPSEATPWQQISVSSFSAGYGAVREILKTPRHFAQIDAVAAADSIYAGVRESPTHREVNQRHMQDFLRFAKQACNGKKTFVLSHSAQRTPYASTTETADYLLHALELGRTSDTSVQSAALRQTSRAARGNFTVWGFEGDARKDHMQHLHHIDLLWNHMASP
jgi:hypothetical protein